MSVENKKPSLAGSQRPWVWVVMGLACFAVAAAIVATKAIAPRANEPIVSVRIRDEDRSIAYLAARAAAKGSYEEAASHLARVAVPKAVTVAVASESSALPETERRAIVAESLKAWAEAARGRWEFRLVSEDDDPCLLVAFSRTTTTAIGDMVGRACLDLNLHARASRPPKRERRGVLTVATMNPSLPKEHSRASLLHLVSKGIGGYLGLGDTREAGALMGPDPHTERAPFQPGDEEIAILERYHRFLEDIRKAASERRVRTFPAPNAQLNSVSQHGGEHWKGDTAHYEFTIRNTGDAPLELAPLPSCGCTVGSYDRVIPPGATSKIVAELDTSGFRGEIEKALNLATNCPENPKLALKLAARVKPTFDVEPPEPVSIALPMRGEYRQTLRVRPRREPNARIVGLRPSARYLSGSVLRGEDREGAYYDVELAFDESAPQGAVSVTIALETDSSREPSVPVLLKMEKGFVVAPQALYFGAITDKTPVPLIRAVTVTRKLEPFKIVKVACDDPRVALSVVPVRQGHEYRILASYRGGWVGRRISTAILIETDDPTAAAFRVPVTANIPGALGE